MAVLPIYSCFTPTLRRKAKPVRALDENLPKFVEDMFETMRKANGVGLAANQVGELQRVIVVDLSGTEEYKEFTPVAMINPVIVAQSGEIVMEEGCLSIPEIREEVKRAEKITVQFKDLGFQDHEVEASGMFARVVQHEIDHLDGVLFIDHLGKVKQKMLRGRLNKIQKGEIEISYPFVAGGSRSQVQGVAHSVPAQKHAETTPKRSVEVKKM